MEDRVSRIAKRIVAGDGNWIDEHRVTIWCEYSTDKANMVFEDNFNPIDCEGTYPDNSDVAYQFDPREYSADDIFEITDYVELADYLGYDYDYRQYIDNLDSNDIAEKILSVIPIERLSSMFMEDFEGENDFADWIDERSEEEENESDNKYEWLLDLLPDAAADAIENEAKESIELPEMEKLWKLAASGECGIGLKEGWSCFESHGNSQGDCATVFGKSEDIDPPGNQCAISHMLWDVPVYCMVKIDYDEYYIDSEMKDEYCYDKDEAIEIMRRLMGDKWNDQIEEYLEKNMPDEPEYSY